MIQENRNALSSKPGSGLHLLLTVSLLALAACSGGGGSNQSPDNAGIDSVAVRSKPLPAGDADCPNGGILVETGIDENGNGLLDDNEVDKAEKVCNGEDGAGGQDGSNGLNSLVTFSDEPAGSNCPYGGMRVDSGLDDNGNGSLESGEIDQTGFVCSQIAGEIGWQVAELIETDNAGDTFAPQIAIDPDGNAIAVWYQSDGTRYNIMANRYIPGFGWGAAQLIETDNAGGAYNPQIAIDANGNAIAVWHQSDGSRDNIMVNRFTPGSGWGATELIETDDAGRAVLPQIAIATDGSAIAVWEQDDGIRNNIWANRYIPGSGWSAAELIETDDAGVAYFPQIAIAADGNAIAVWQQSDGTRNNIWANRYIPGSGWGAAELIETDDAGGAYNPQIAIDANGNAIAVWAQSDSTRDNIWTNRYTLGSGWGTAELIETDDAGDASDPQIAIDANGNAIAVWAQSDSTSYKYNILANRYMPGSGWGSAKLIETGNAGHATNPQIAIDASGNGIVVWEQSDDTRYNIWANRYTPGSGLGSAQLIETDNSGNVYSPQIAIDANGNAIAVWSQSDGALTTNIWFNRWVAP